MLKEKQKQLAFHLLKLKKQNKDLKKIYVTFEGSGDSFDEFYDVEITLSNGKILYNLKDLSYEDYSLEDILFNIIDLTDADFNNDGSRGTISIDFEKFNYVCEVEHYVTDLVQGEGVEDNFIDVNITNDL